MVVESVTVLMVYSCSYRCSDVACLKPYIVATTKALVDSCKACNEDNPNDSR